MKTVQLQVAALTDVGLVRNRNEDSMTVLPNEGLVMISDGLGGHRAGDVASRMVVRLLPEMLARGLSSVPPENSVLTNKVIRDIITDLSRELRSRAGKHPAQFGMGATLVMALFLENRVHIAAMGDSRAYLCRQRELKRLTEDHSVLGILLSQGVVTREQAQEHEARGRLTRYIGMEGEVYPDVGGLDLVDGDRFVLCSDGLTAEVADETIAEILQRGTNVEEICSCLVHAAKEAGGSDNITVIVAEWWGDR
jgi:PPM family protein phosphatase